MIHIITLQSLYEMTVHDQTSDDEGRIVADVLGLSAGQLLDGLIDETADLHPLTRWTRCHFQDVQHVP